MSPTAEYNKCYKRTSAASSTSISYHRRGHQSVVFGPNIFSRVAQIAALIEQFERRLDDVSKYEAGEPRPSEQTRREIWEIIATSEISIAKLNVVDISTFYGELHLTWETGRRQVTLVCGGSVGKTPKLHYYEGRDNQPTLHGLIPDVTGDVLMSWIRWLDAQ
ncbi:MAG: hypothetical protein ACHQ1H_13635 [Nitrososphaerales archaeon]|jgi:hypothetical protein